MFSLVYKMGTFGGKVKPLKNLWGGELDKDIMLLLTRPFQLNSVK